jgi:hypothetical protein
MNLPTLGQVTYYMADDEIPVSAPGLTMVSILPNTTYALYNTGKNRFMLITPKRQMNIDGSTALELSQSGTVIKTEIGEGKVMKKGILESLLFLEAESAISAAETDPVIVPDVSLDQKVDRYLIRYEREAVPTSAIYSPKVQTQVNTANGAQSSGGTAAPLPPYSESKVSKKGLLESMLFEADPAQEVPGGPPAGGMDAGGFGGAGGDPAADMGGDLGGEMGDPGADASTEKTPPIIDTPKMNLNDYCRAVARLISNYEALLDPKTTIFNRAKEYVRVNYDEATSKMFEEIMTDKLGVNPTPPERDARMAPPASNAIYGGEGGGGGAG